MKSTTSLSPRLAARLAKYSAAAAAGAVTLSSSQAAIVYINYGDLLIQDPTPNDGVRVLFDFDIDQNGAVDLRWRQSIEADNTPQNFAGFRGPVGGTIATVGAAAGAYLYPARLAAGASVGGSAAFITVAAAGAAASMAYGAGFSNSQWAGNAPNNTGYLGFRFTRAGQQHYAWVRVTVNQQDHPTAPRAMTIHEGAYEDTPGAGLAAGAGAIPEPGSLALLALGSLGLARRRRRSA